MKRMIKRISLLTALVALLALLTAAVYAEQSTPEPGLVFDARTQLTVYLDGQQSDNLSDVYNCGETATLRAAPTITDKSFSHWEADGSVISYASELKLTMNAHTTLYAVYADNAPTTGPVAGFTSITRTNDGTKISFHAIAYPNGGAVTGAGIVYSATATGDALTIDGTGVTNVQAEKLTDSTTTLPASIMDDNNCWMLQITPEAADTLYHARAYVTTSDGTTTYGDEKNVKLSDLQSGVSLTVDPNSFDPNSFDPEQSLETKLANLRGSIRTITFDPNGGEGTMAPQGVLIGEETALNTNTFTREGYAFNGWSTNENGGGTTYSDGQSVSLSEDTTLYAQWRSNSGGNNGNSGGTGHSSSSGGSTTTTPSATTTTTTSTDNTSNPDASTTNGTATVTTTKNADGSTTTKTTETATKTGEDGSKTQVKSESTTTTKTNRDGTTTNTTTASSTATTMAADGTKTVTETKTEAKETLDQSGNGTVETTTTETVKDRRGNVTATTVTESAGTVETATDGTKTTTTTNTSVTTDAAGNTTTTVTTEKAVETADGSTGKVVKDENGKAVSIEAKVSETAAESGEKVTLPVTVNTEDATPVEITVPADTESIKVEIPVENVTPGTVAVLVNPDGSEEIVKTSVTGETGVTLTLDGGASVKVVDNAKAFSDVNGSEWFANNVAWASSREIMQGIGNDTFAPNADTNRAMVTQILYNLDNGKASGTIPTFDDVSEGDWYALSVAWAVENGVARGEGERFGANDPITREQLAVMLYNYAHLKGYDTSVSADVSRFADGSDTSSWAADAIAWAVGLGIINGTTDESGNVILDPQGSATRAQVTAMMERFCELTA